MNNDGEDNISATIVAGETEGTYIHLGITRLAHRDTNLTTYTDYGIRNLDIVFVLDCTESMQKYHEATVNMIISIIYDIAQRQSIRLRCALVEYRDHPPEIHEFVARTYNFETPLGEIIAHLRTDSCRVGGDGPEAVADGLNKAFHLLKQSACTKICILLCDAPPHGVDPETYPFLDECICGLSPLQISTEMKQEKIILYTIGMEPSIRPYRAYYEQLSRNARGEYLSFTEANANGSLIQKIIQDVFS